MAQIQRRETADGEVRYTMRVFMGRHPETGKRRFITKTYDRKRDAEQEARRLERSKDLGALVEPSKETFSAYLQRWLDEVKDGRVRARTLHDYRGMVRRYIQEPPEGADPIGTIRLDELKPAAFQALYAHLWKVRELSPRTIRYLHTILRQALGHAVLTGALPRNPTDAVKPPSRPYAVASGKARDGRARKAQRAMTEAQAARFLEAARDDRYHSLWAVLLTGGIRPGEALGLTWPDVDLERSRIHVRRSLSRVGVDGWQFVEPKTAKARRVVVLPGVAIAALREWRALQGRERLLLGAEYQDHGLVFTTPFGSPPDQSSLTSRHFRPILERAELGNWEGEGKERTFRPGFRVYDLRHTCATLLLKRGVNPKIVQERLGHATIVLTLDTYSHVLPDMQGAAAEELEAVFGGPARG